MAALPPFHLAFPVHDLAAARHFYGSLLGCPEGRSSSEWVDFDFYGVLDPADWRALADRVATAGVAFGIAPHTRFAGQAGEQSTMFFLDPSGNALEFKAFKDPSRLFAK